MPLFIVTEKDNDCPGEMCPYDTLTEREAVDAFRDDMDHTLRPYRGDSRMVDNCTYLVRKVGAPEEYSVQSQVIVETKTVKVAKKRRTKS